MERARRGWRRWGHRLDIAMRLATTFVMAEIFGGIALLLLLGMGPLHFIGFLLVVLLILLALTFPWWLLWLDEDWRLRRARRGSEWRQALAEAASVEIEPSEAELIAAREKAAEAVWVATLAIGFLAIFTVTSIVMGHISRDPSRRFDPRDLTLIFLPAFGIAFSCLLFRLARYRQRARTLKRVLRGETAG